MISRGTFVLPGSGSSPIVVPKENTAWRLWAVVLDFECSADAGDRHAVLLVQDGALNTVARFQADKVTAAEFGQVMWAPGIETLSRSDASIPQADRQVAIPVDLWIQPTWTTSVLFNTAFGADLLQQAVFTKDVRARKSVAEKGEDS
jgi:flagellar biosynthesis regulator FlaF